MIGHNTKKRCLKFRVECIALICIVLVGNVWIRPEIVRADEGVSLAEYVLTLFASLGVGISDENILNAMTQYMNIDTNSDPGRIQSAIENCETVVGSQFITNTFKSDNNSTQEYVQIVGDEYIDGVSDYTASAAENISASIENYNDFGFVSIVEGGKRLSFGTPMAKLADIALNVASIGWDKFTAWAGNLISSGLGMSEVDYAAKSGLGQGAYMWDMYNPSDSPYFFCTNNENQVIVGHYEDEVGPYVWIVNNHNVSISLRYYYRRRGGSGGAITSSMSPGTYYKAHARGVSPSGKAVWGGVYGDPQDYVGVNNPPIYSPDIITTDGNARPGMHRPTYSHNSENPYLQPITLDVYLHWADDARQNTEEGNTGEGQGDDFLNFIIPFLKPQFDVDGIPQGSINSPNPVYPSQPTYIPFPTYDPVASPTPATEVIPAPTLTPQELEQELENKTIRNLANVFPFCIPFDIVSLFKKMYVSRKAPVITWETNFGQFGTGGTITIDFSMFDGVASVCRTFELILFILGLMIATKNLIGWGG